MKGFLFCWANSGKTPEAFDCSCGIQPQSCACPSVIRELLCAVKPLWWSCRRKTVALMEEFNSPCQVLLKIALLCLNSHENPQRVVRRFKQAAQWWTGTMTIWSSSWRSATRAWERPPSSTGTQTASSTGSSRPRWELTSGKREWWVLGKIKLAKVLPLYKQVQYETKTCQDKSFWSF